MAELAITDSSTMPVPHGKAAWITQDTWDLFARLKPGQMVEITGLLDGRKANNVNATFQWGLPRRKLHHLKLVRRADRVFIVHREQRDGAG